MVGLEPGELRVIVPVGFLLTEEQEVSVSVDLPSGGSLPIRLRLIPARSSAVAVSDPTPASLEWPALRYSDYSDDGYPEPEYGGEN